MELLEGATHQNTILSPLLRPAPISPQDQGLNPRRRNLGKAAGEREGEGKKESDGMVSGVCLGKNMENRRVREEQKEAGKNREGVSQI